MRIFLVLLFLTNGLFALPKHFVSTSSITVGETFTYTIAIPSDASVTINPTLSQFDVINSFIEEDENERRYKYELQAFTIENLVIPTMSITEINDIPPVILNPIYLVLQTTLSPTANELNDIAPLLDIFYINLVYLFIFLLVVVIIAVAIFSALRRKKQQQYQQSLQKDPPIKIALEEISKLKKSLNNDPVVIKNGYFKLTEIIGKFITDEIEINVQDATTIEMKRMLKNTKKIKDINKTIIINLSEKMDHYKFSQNPTLDKKEIDQSILKAENLIEGISK